MKILIVSQYFWPEEFTINEVAKTLVEKGNVVDVLTCMPNYPGADTASNSGNFSWLA